MSECSLTAEEVFDSLTGFDEIAIAQQFGHTVADLAQNDVSMFARALVFVAKRRDGLTDDEAKTAAFTMSLKETNSFFAEVAAEEESGKDEPPAESPATSLSSVS
jgi:hypothetical protein